AQRDQASARHIVAMQTICADLDTGDIAAKLRHLKRYAGEPSMVVASGGLTDKRQEKVHVYWKLTEPAVDTDVERGCRLRGELIHRVGADPSFRSAHQPIRVAGSLYRKGGTTKLVEIREINHREYDLSELAERIEAMPTLSYAERGDPQPQFTKGNGRATGKLSVDELLNMVVREDGVDGVTRFQAFSQVAGYFIAQARHGQGTLTDAFEKARNYGLNNLDGPWPEQQIKKEFNALLSVDARKHPAQQEYRQPKSAGTVDDSGDINAQPRSLAEVERVFDDWLCLPDHTPLYAMLGTIAANRLPGDPVWLGIIAPPSSAKTELLNSTSKRRFTVEQATLTPA